MTLNQHNTHLRCASYCLGENYQLHKIADSLLTMHIVCELYDTEVLHAQFPLEEEDLQKGSCDVFIFEYGCVVFWGATPYDEKLILKKLSKHLVKPMKTLVQDSCHYIIDEESETGIDEESDLITLGVDTPILKMSLSYGLSQSVKLIVFEGLVDSTIDTTTAIPQELIAKGKISMSRKNLARKMGELFAVKSLINLHSVILDTPQFFWRKPRYEQYYVMAINFLDINTRLGILNTRLDVIHELYMMMCNELQHIHSSRLEVTIIFLIMMEIVIAVWHDLVKFL